MGKAEYEQSLRSQCRELGIAIGEIRQKLKKGVTDRQKVELMARVSELQVHRREIDEKLTRLDGQPDSMWTNLKADVAQQWGDMVHDLEERWGALP